MSFTTLLTSVYNKEKLLVDDINIGLCIALSKWLSFDISNIYILNKIVKYMFFVEPETYYYLLYFNISKKQKIPYLSKIDKIEEKEDELMNKIKETLFWSNREYNYHKDILDKIINRDYWSQQLGVKIDEKS